MTVSAPDRVSDSGDLIDRVLASGDPDAAAGSLIWAIRSGRGGGPLLAVLANRLGDEHTRATVSNALAQEAASTGSHLLGQVADFIQYGSASQAAMDVTRILTDAVVGGTSEQRLLPPVRALMRALVSLNGPDSALAAVQPYPRETPHQGSERRGVTGHEPAADPAISAQAKTRPRDGERRGTTGAVQDAFRIPDQVERVGERGEALIAPLFRADGQGRGPGPVRVPAALMSPPKTTDPELIRSWLRGEPAFLDSIGISCGLLETGDPGDLMELDAEFHADPYAALRLYKARDQVADGTADAAWCARLGRDIGRFGVTHDRAVDILADTLSRYLRTHDPERSAVLLRAGAILKVKEQLAEAVCGLIDAEQDFISDGPRDVSGPPQNLLGSFTATADLSGGLCLERAFFIHLMSSVPFGTAMRQSVTEFRVAQAIRENPEAPFAFLIRRYDIDAALPLSELSGREAIVRLGFTEPSF